MGVAGSKLGSSGAIAHQYRLNSAACYRAVTTVFGDFQSEENGECVTDLRNEIASTAGAAEYFSYECSFFSCSHDGDPAKWGEEREKNLFRHEICY